MNEAKFSSWLMQHWLSGDGVHAQRIETTTGSGIPDINFCVRSLEGWIETKVFTPSGTVLLRPYQRAWMHRRKMAGGECFVVALDNEGDVCAWRYDSIEGEMAGDYFKITSKPSTTLVRHSTSKQDFLKFISRLSIN